MSNIKNKSGYVAIIGRSNVGKSTFVNKILGKKISITSSKRQTTRNKILGIKTLENSQIIYVDTPGIHTKAEKALNKCMNEAALKSIHGIDIVVFMTEGTKWTVDDELVFKYVRKLKCPAILAINKVDIIKNKNLILEFISKLVSKLNFVEVIPISAKTGYNIDTFEKIISALIPEHPFYFPKEQLTDKNEFFLISEIIREKATRLLGQELPYNINVFTESCVEKGTIVHISALIYVEKDSQKQIIIGKNGEKIKEINTKARLDIEKLLGKHVFLTTWVKVRSGWSDNELMLRKFGYIER